MKTSHPLAQPIKKNTEFEFGEDFKRGIKGYIQPIRCIPA